MGALADRIFDAQVATGLAEGAFDDELAKWFGRPWWDEPALLENITFDYYDRSFELLGCPVELRMPPEALPAIWEAGFHRFWLNHTDGTETAYVKGGKPEGYTRRRPWGSCATPTDPPRDTPKEEMP